MPSFTSARGPSAKPPSLSVSPTKASTAASRSETQSKKSPDASVEAIIGIGRRYNGPHTPHYYEKSQEFPGSELFLASLALVNLVLGPTSITWRPGFFVSHKICLLQQFSSCTAISISFLPFLQSIEPVQR
jgi:hypothetical protein